MKLQNYGYILWAPGYHPATQRATMASPEFRTTIIGVSSKEEAAAAAREMAATGVEVIELCGGFGEERAREVIAAVGGKVPVGYVTFSPAEEEKLAQFLRS